MARKRVSHRRNPQTGRPTVFNDTEGAIVFENIAQSTPTIEQTKEPWYLRIARGRGNRDNNNASRVSDYFDETKERLENIGQDISEGKERKG